MNQTISSSKGEFNAALLNFKDEEKQLSESLYRNLHVMIRFYEPTKEFSQFFEPYMFVKSNPTAFLYVMHFIFMCLDVNEFKKRFRWPPVDNNSLTQFRRTTVDYMNHLNVTHQLGLEPLKLHNVHNPGGLKFIKIIHRFTFLIMKVELEKSKLKPLPNFHEIPDANEQFGKLEEYVDEGLNFATRLEAQSVALSNRIDELNGMMESFFENVVPIEPKEKRCWTCLAMKWRDELNSVVHNEVKPCLERVNEVSKRGGQLNKQLTELFVDRKENACQYDKVKFSTAQKNLNKRNPNLEPAINGIVQNHSINIENLLTVFTFSLPQIMKKIETHHSFEALEFEDKEIENLKTKASTVEETMIDSEMMLEPYQGMDEEGISNFRLSNPLTSPTLPFSLLFTPQITRQSDFSRITHRLASMDGKFGPVKLFKEPLPPMNGTIRKLKSSNRRISIGQSSSHQLTSMNASLNLISRRKSINPYATTCKTSTPMPPICNSVTDHRRNNRQNSQLVTFQQTPTHAMLVTTPENSVDRFIQSNRAIHFRSPSRRFGEADRATNVSRNLLPTMLPTMNGYRDAASFSMSVGNISMNGRRCDSNAANLSDDVFQ